MSNLIESYLPTQLATEPAMIVDEKVIDSRYQAYLQDESRLAAKHVSSLSFPKSTEEVSAILKEFSKQGKAVALSGGRTGLCGAAVPEEESNVVSLEKLKKLTLVSKEAGEVLVKVGAGVTLAELQEFVGQEMPDYYFPVDPTEQSATVGGAISTNASGARSYRFGAIRNWVMELTVVLPTGHVCELKRDQVAVSEQGVLRLKRDDVVEELKLATIVKPQCKNVVGYDFYPGLDAVDLFVSSEGTIGVVVEAVLKLEPLPKGRLYFLQLFENEKSAVDFVAQFRKSSLDALAIEYFDDNSLRLLRENSATIDSRAVRMISDKSKAAIFCDLVVESEDELVSAFEILEEILTNVGSSIEQSIAGTEDKDLRDIKVFRHAVPENINRLLAERKKDIPNLHKISTDMSVPEKSFVEMNDFYRETLVENNLEHYIFGHIGEHHLHVNMVPRSESELLKAKELYELFAKKIVSLNGAVSAEHGIGKLKKPFLRLQHSPDVIDSMRKMKKFFDPNWILNPGVLFDRE